MSQNAKIRINVWQWQTVVTLFKSSLKVSCKQGCFCQCRKDFVEDQDLLQTAMRRRGIVMIACVARMDSFKFRLGKAHAWLGKFREQPTKFS